MNRNVLGRDWLKQFGVQMYCNLGCVQVGKSNVKGEEDFYISSHVRPGTKKTIKPQTGNLCWGKIMGNTQLSKTKLHQVMSIKENHEPSVIIIVKVNNQARFSIFTLNTTNKTTKLKKVALWEKLNQFKNVTSLTWRHCRSRKKKL